MKIYQDVGKNDGHWSWCVPAVLNYFQVAPAESVLSPSRNNISLLETEGAPQLIQASKSDRAL